MLYSDSMQGLRDYRGCDSIVQKWRRNQKAVHKICYTNGGIAILKENYADEMTWRDEDEPYIFELWRVPNMVVGSQRQDFRTEQVARFPVQHRFNTSFGWFVLVSNDETITLNEAIRFGRAFAHGKYVTWRVDLETL